MIRSPTTARTGRSTTGGRDWHEVAAASRCVLDLYEHAHAIDHGAATKAYLDAFMANVLWTRTAASSHRGRKTT
jgi:superoxide dismutase